MRTTRTGVQETVAEAKKKSEESQESYAVKKITIDDKLAILEKMGRSDLVDIFKGWEPRQARQKKSAPLNQKVSITVTDAEKVSLLNEVKLSNKDGAKETVSQFIRNRSISSIDIQGWKRLAEEALFEINQIDLSKKDLKKRKRELRLQLDEAEDVEDIAMLDKELAGINNKLRKITAQNEKRDHRLAGRMSMVEAETIKWKAQRLCISTSDYLRFVLFDLLPNTSADAHMSLDAKRRFYVSIIDVAQNGWGSPPSIAHCTQCNNYLDEISRLSERVKQLETFL